MALTATIAGSPIGTLFPQPGRAALHSLRSQAELSRRDSLIDVQPDSIHHTMQTIPGGEELFRRWRGARQGWPDRPRFRRCPWDPACIPLVEAEWPIAKEGTVGTGREKGRIEMRETELTLYQRHRTAARIVIGLLAVIVVLVVFLPSLVAPWSRLNNTEGELDLFSGRMRTTRYFLWIQIAREIDETPVSKALGRDANDQERWVRTHVFQPFRRVSPQYIHGSSPAAINHLARIWDVQKFTPEAREKTARQLLRMLRKPGARAVEPWFEALDELSAGHSPDVPVTAEEIPQDDDFAGG